MFAKAPHSPLTPDQRGSFRGLSYFDENPQLVIHAGIDPDVESGEVPMATSGGEEQVYRRYGRVRFHVDDQLAQLVLYASPTTQTSSSSHSETRRPGKRPTVRAATWRSTRTEATSRSTSTMRTTPIAPTTHPGAVPCPLRRTGSRSQSVPVRRRLGPAASTECSERRPAPLPAKGGETRGAHRPSRWSFLAETRRGCLVDTER